MKVAIFDVDSKIPNLALMKLSRFHKQQGHAVELYDPLWRDTYDKIYASKIFKYPHENDQYLDPDHMEIGGTGWDMAKELPPEIYALQPDYSLYGYQHNMGFTMRGCRFRCKFCVVPQKEGKAYSNNSIDDIWTQRDSDFIMLLDNDFFGNPSWRDRVNEITAHRLRVNFNQGLNIRIITEEQATALASVDFRNMHNTRKQVYFAWDQWGAGTEKVIIKGFQTCLDAGIKPGQMAFYVLIGFNTTPEQDMYRVMKLRELGADPYVMPYDKEDPYQKKFARWVNAKPLFKSTPWEDYHRSMKKADLDTATIDMFANNAA